MQILVLALLIATSCCAFAAAPVSDYPYKPVPFQDVKIQDAFWSPRMETNRLRTVWYDFEKCEETGRIDNFAKAGKLMEGPFRGTPYDDSDVFKVIEGAAYTLAVEKDPKLDKYLDDLIVKIAAAQESDGYLYTARTIDPKTRPDFIGPERWSNLKTSHELYNVGHLYEAAVAHHAATGKRSLLNVALKNADLVCRVFGPGPGQSKEPPGHQEIEIGLVKLFRATGEKKYLDQARFFCDLRGRADTHTLRGPYQQDHKPLMEQDEAVGHSVRAGYYYSGVADVAALTGDRQWIAAIDRLWENVVQKKMHLSGGIGASPKGEAFGADYELPNASAYLETCAAIANAFWNHRMFLLHGDPKYIDVLERVIYNGFLAGVGLTGDRFFYPNPLETDGKAKFNHGSNERAPWFGCSCCPVNDVRFMPEIASYAYATREKDLFVNLYIGSTASVRMPGGIVIVRQQTGYPWNGKVRIEVEPEKPQDFTLHLRVPGWAEGRPVPSDLYTYVPAESNPSLKIRTSARTKKVDSRQGYASFSRRWEKGDFVELEFPMPVRKVVSHSAVQENKGRFAIERGPIMYCAEGADNGGTVLGKVLQGKLSFDVIPKPELLGGIQTIKVHSEDGTELTCIPYYAWCHRGPNEMRVWFPASSSPAGVASAAAH
jgi:DUF1680 family protein